MLLLTFVAITTTEVKAQNQYDVKGTVKKSRKRLEGAVVTLYKGSSQITQQTTNSTGRFDIKMDLNGEYTLTISKAGHITKKFYFNTKGVPDDRAKEEFGGQDIEVSIFEMPKDPGVVSQINSILSQPMAKFYYDDKIKEIDFDKAYSQSMLDALDKLNQIEKEAIKKAEEEEKNKTALESAAASKYEAAIIKGDAAFGKKDYTTARAAYTEALGIKPGEEYPKNKIIEIEKLIADAAKNAALENDYKAAIAKADAAFTGKNYDAAKTSYNDALKLKPAEAYPKTKLDEIAKIQADLAKGAELEGKYKAAIAKGDAGLAAKTYESAKAAYTEASTLKPAEKYPKDKIAEIDKILADIAAKEKADKELDDKYKAAIANADKSFNSKLYSFAKPGYEEALKLKPNEAYPKQKIAEIDKILADIAAKENSEKALAEKYAAAIAKGDKALAAKDYVNAKVAYNEALGVKATEQYPKDKIAEIDKAIADAAAKDAAEKDRLAKEKALNDKYNAAIAKGDAALAKKDYVTAKAGYNEALSVKSAEQYPKDKIAEIDKAIADASKDAAEKDRLAKEKALNDKYNAAVAKGDAAFAKKDYTNAKAGYNEALGVKPTEQYPKDKLAEIDKAIAAAAADAAAEKDRLAKLAEIEAKYKAAIAKGDAALKAKTYDAAKTAYNEALAVKSAEQYPKDKIAEIDALIAKEMGAKELNDKYNAAISKADAAFKTKSYADAKTSYNDALGFKPAEAYPKAQIAAIDKAIADAAAKDAAEQARLAKEKELNEKYTAAIAKGDASFGSKDYDAAKTAYTEASTLKAAEKYPKDKITEINAILAKEMGAKALEEKYKAAIAKGDGALSAKTYAVAKTAYTEALGLKPTEQYPKDKLAEVEKALADEAAANKGKELEAKYIAAIAKGDAAFGTKTYAVAKTAYTEASTLKPSEQYPKDKLAEIEKAIAGDAAEKDRLAKEKELNAKYAAAIAKGDAALKAKTYAPAKAAYGEALALKESEQYPKDKIAEIDAILAKEMGAKELNEKYAAAITKADAAFKTKSYDDAKAAYNDALGFKPAEAYPKAQLAAIDKAIADAANKDAAEQARLAKEKELAAKYAAAIAKGDASLGTKNYDDAKASYNEALTYKATEKYPKDKIAEINAILAKEMGAKELEKKYADAIAKGDSGLGAKDYATAKTQYTAALALKPTEQYPKDKLAEVEKALADIAAANKGKELEAKYIAAIAKGDAALSAKTYAAAKTAYTEASTLKPSEQYPKDKLAELDGLMAGDAAEKARLAKEKELEAKYKAAIAKGDAAFKAKTYAAAKTAYNDALGVKPGEQYPTDKLAEIETLLGAAASEKDRLALEAKYNAAIVKGDAAFKTKTYAAAKTAYFEALGIKSGEKYPTDKIAEIDKLISEMSNKDAAARILNEKYLAAIALADDAFTETNYAGAKKYYTDALELKPAEKYPKDKIAILDGLLAKELGAKEMAAKYKAAIAKGDEALNSKDYTAAKASYTEAASIKPTEQYPKDQLVKVNGYLAEIAKTQAIQAKFDAAVAKADGILAKKDYANAILAYKDAQAIKPNEPYPTNKIKEINTTLDDLARAKEKDAQYNDVISKADKLFALKDYKSAKSRYLDASLIKSSEQYPKDKVAEIDVLMKKKNTTTTATTGKNEDFKSDLAKKYPEGITEESGTENNAKVTKRIVVKGLEGHLYVKKETSFGPVYFFKDNVAITETEYLRDTEVQQE